MQPSDQTHSQHPDQQPQQQPQQQLQLRPEPAPFALVSDDEQYERMHNAASFTEIPDEQLPDDKITRRRILLNLELRALAGYDCDAYRPAFQPEYVIWDRQPHPWQESRFTPRAWAELYGYIRADGEEGTRR